MMISDAEKEYLDRFEKGEYKPELVFEDDDILKNIKNHPMALWKMQEHWDNSMSKLPLDLSAA